MKKIIPVFIAAVIVLSACGANDSTTPTAGPSATQGGGTRPTQVSAVETPSRLGVGEEALRGTEVAVWVPWYGVESSLFDTFVKEFNEGNQWGIRVNVQNRMNFSNLYETTTASLPTSQRPSLVIALPEHAQEWYTDGAAMDLTGYVDDPKYGIDARDIPYVFWGQDTAAGARVGVPAQRTARFLLWNETWAKSLGFDSAPQDAGEFQQQACRARESMLKDADPRNDFLGGWLVDADAMTAYGWMTAFGGGVLEEGNYRFLEPGNVEAFKFLRELSEAHCAWQAAGVDALSAFAKREALFITADLHDLPFVARAIAAENSADQWRVIPFPGRDNSAVTVYGSSYVVLKAGDAEMLAAWLFVRWLLENERDARWVETTHLFPLRASTLDLLGDYEKTYPQWRQAVDLIPQGAMQPQLASWRTVKIMLGDGFAHMYRVNVSSGQVAAILAQMEATARELSE
jgi:ABC-type glycerol-3-phosphate transport system substrate-binding protein